MSHSFHVVWVGRDRCDWANDAVQEWTKRMQRYGGIDETRLPPARFSGDVAAVRAAEAKATLARLKVRDVVIALDERGERMDTQTFAKLLDGCRQRAPRVVFTIGGPYGHAPEVRDRAFRTLRLSDMVLNHQVARLVLFEQIYRAMNLLEGGPYHH